jgi:xanthine dehydrogenase accessory factor
MVGIHEILNAVEGFSGEDVLATVIRVEGSAYRKEGASMMIKNDGTTIGMLSAGCLETDLLIRAQELKGKKKSRTIVYDMSAEDDLSWGQGAGCNGRVSILLEPIDIYLHGHLSMLKNHLYSGNCVTLIKKLNKDHSVSDYIFLTGDDEFFGVWHGPIPFFILRGFQRKISKNGIVFVPELSAEIYIQSYEPKPRLIIFGAGFDAIPVVKVASQTGFSVTVSDWRPGLCHIGNYPEANQLILGYPHEAIQMLDLTTHDSVLLLTHHFQRDKELLGYLINKKLNYLGVLGPLNRTQKLLEGQRVPSFIHSPVGLAIGAEGPEEIAISIVAELIKTQRHKHLEKGRNHEKGDYRCLSSSRQQQ